LAAADSGTATGRFDARRHVHERYIADVVTKTIINRFEMIDVDHGNGQLVATSARRLNARLSRSSQRAPIR